MLKRLNGEVDYVTDQRFDGKVLILSIPIDIVANKIWPLVRKDEAPNRLNSIDRKPC